MVCQQRASPLNKPPAFNFAHPSGNDSPQCWQVLSDCLICSSHHEYDGSLVVMLRRYHKLYWDKRKIYRSHLAVDLFWFNRKGKRRLTRLLIVYIGLAKSILYSSLRL